VTSQAALVNIQRVSKDCALSEVTRDGLDTAEVWGSSPHAPTIFVGLFRYFPPPSSLLSEFGRLRFRFNQFINQFIRRDAISLTAFISVYSDKNDYA
jgi:hypothetical protein